MIYSSLISEKVDKIIKINGKDPEILPLTSFGIHPLVKLSTKNPILIVMANLQASKKDIRKTAKRTMRNRIVRSELKTLAKRVAQCDKSDLGTAKALAQSYISALDKAAKRGIIHPNKVSRHKSHLAALFCA